MRGLDDALLILVVSEAEPDDASIGEMTVKIEKLEWQPFEMAQQPSLLLGIDEIGLIAKPFRAFHRRTEKVALTGPMR